MSEVLDSQLKFTESGGQGWWIASGVCDEYYYEADAAQSEYTLDDGEESCLQAIVDSPNSETVKFYWKVSSRQGYDYLGFYIDGVLKDQISGEPAATGAGTAGRLGESPLSRGQASASYAQYRPTEWLCLRASRRIKSFYVA